MQSKIIFFKANIQTVYIAYCCHIIWQIMNTICLERRSYVINTVIAIQVCYSYIFYKWNAQN